MTISAKLTSLLALCAVGLASCSYAGADADREAAAQPAAEQPAQQPAPAPAPTPTDTAAEPTAAPAPSDGGGDTTLPSDGGGAVAAQPSDGGGALPTPTVIPLIDTSEGAVTYLRAIQNFSPTIESWQIKDGQLHYISYNCIGTVEFEAYASVRPGKEGRSTVRWEGNAPGFDQTGEEDLLIDETTLQYSDSFEDDGPANTHYQAELGEFGRKCAGAGKDLAAFVL